MGTRLGSSWPRPYGRSESTSRVAGRASNLHLQRISLSASRMQCLSYQPGNLRRIGRSLFVCLCGRTKRCEWNDWCSEVTFKTGSCVIKFTSGSCRRWLTSALFLQPLLAPPLHPHPTPRPQVLVMGRGAWHAPHLAFFSNSGVYCKYHVSGCLYSEADVWIPEPFHAEVPTDWWDKEADKSLLIGVFKHGRASASNPVLTMCLCLYLELSAHSFQSHNINEASSKGLLASTVSPHEKSNMNCKYQMLFLNVC